MSSLQQLGFELERQSGSHVRLSCGSMGVTVPVPDVVAPGILESILRQERLTTEELLHEV